MQKSRSRQTWLIAGFVAAILCIGAVASNLIASDLEMTLKPYRLWVWLVFVIALIVAVVGAIFDVRRSVHSSEHGNGIGGKVQDSTIVIGGGNVICNDFDGDFVRGDKIINIQQNASTAIRALHQIRAPVSDFVGREQDAATVINGLRRNRHACISGMGGIGKTELAVLVAGRLSAEYRDAHIFIDLRGTDSKPRSPEEILMICIRAFLGLEVRLPEDLDQLRQLYLSQLTGKHVLLLLDNATDSDQVHPLLPPRGSALLVTSRHAIAFPGVTPLTLTPLPDKDARELLLAVVPRAEPAAKEIGELCGNLPLAIRAAGGLLAVTRDLESLDYAAQLKEERSRLERIGATGVQISVEASFNLTYTQLTPEAARVFRFLSIFPATFDAAAEEVICADADHTKLTDLVRRSLVFYDSSTKRYRLHDLVRLFAGAKLNAEESAAAAIRHASHYRDLLYGANKLYEEGGEALADGIALFDLEWSNIEAGHAWLVAQDMEANEEVAQLAADYALYGGYTLPLRLHLREQISWLEIALTAARRLNNQILEAAVLTNLGNPYANLGETKRAIQCYEQALPIQREIGNRKAEGVLLNNLGNAYSDLGEIERAIQFFEQRIIISREIGDRRGEGSSLNNLGNSYSDLGEIQHAIQCYEEALLIQREVGNREGEGNALNNLGLAYGQLGEVERAIHFFEQALNIAHEIGDHGTEDAALDNLGLAYVGLGKIQTGIKFLRRALTLVQEIGDRRQEGKVLHHLGRAHTELGAAQEALDFYQQALLVQREIGDREREGELLWNISLALDQLNERHQAIQYAEQSLAIFQQSGTPYIDIVQSQLDDWREE